MLAIVAGLVLIATALIDAFETIVLPRRVSRRLRVATFFYRLSWPLFAGLSRRIRNDGRREAILSYYGPSSLLLLVAVWAIFLIAGFAAVHWGIGSNLRISADSQPIQGDFALDAYFSGTTFFTLGLGDVLPDSAPARWLTVIEAGIGFIFLALLISYLPVVYQMFARRETNVSLLDQRAGSPPTATELIRRNVTGGDVRDLEALLHNWENWVGDLLESHLSYPTLAQFRSQHENQSWLGALAAILDVSAAVMACGTSPLVRQASFTFAVGRHAVGDLTNLFGIEPHQPPEPRMDDATEKMLWQTAHSTGLVHAPNPSANDRLRAIRSVYEPYLQALSEYLLMDLPPWAPAPDAADNWETTAWDYASPVRLLGPNTPFKHD